MYAKSADDDIVAANVEAFYCQTYPTALIRHNRLVESITAWAAQSPVYAGRVHPIAGVAALQELPITTWADIEQAYRTYGVEDCLLAIPSGHIETSGSTGDPKKLYYSAADFDEYIVSVAEVMYLTGALEAADLSAWHIGVPDPLLPGSIFDRAHERYGDQGRTRQRYVSSHMLKESEFVKVLRLAGTLQGLDVLACYPIVLFLIAQVIAEPETLIRSVAKKIETYRVPHWLARRLAQLYVGRIDLDGARQVIEQVRLGYTFGEHLGPYEKFLSSSYPAMTLVNIYGSTEQPFQGVRLDGGVDDLCCVLRGSVPEIADPSDVEAAKGDPARRLVARPWHEWEPGTRGELIITRAGDCLPLVRYPTGDIVEVVEPEHEFHMERWGRSHTVRLPLIRVLGRTVDVVDFEAPDEWGSVFGYSFYSTHVDNAVSRAGGARWWELYRLPGAPGRLLLWVIMEGDDPAAFQERLMRVVLADGENLGVGVGIAVELEVFDLVVSGPEAFAEIERTVEARIKEGRPLGHIKPKHIYKVASEADYDAILARKRTL